MKIGIPKETFPGERRVAIIPAELPGLKKLGLDAVIEAGAGIPAGFGDDLYLQQGATIAENRAAMFRDGQIIAQVRCYGANTEHGRGDVELFHTGQILLGHGEPLISLDENKTLAETGVTFFAMELIPRITRAQAMDVLSSQANLAGYKAVIIAANTLAKVFPLMMTAAGTIKPAKVFVVGAGVAGLQAIATAKRLGALVSAIDVRPAVKEQVESLGAKFIAPPGMAEGEGGYAKEMTDTQKAEQQKMMADTIADSDVVITTAAIPGRKSPVLISAQTVKRMRPGSVIVDIASERGGNCELTEADKIIEVHGVTIVGTTNIPSTVARDASQTYSRDLFNLIRLIVKDGKATLNMSDQVVADTLLCREGQIVNARVREMMKLPPMEKTESPKSAERSGGS